MHNHLFANRLGRWLAAAAFGLLAAPAAQAQLAGTKAIPGDYATVAAAITDLNTQGVGAGGVTFNIAAGYTETFASPTAGAITATGTAANPIVFQKSGTGANPLITAGVGTTTTLDAIISLAGSDYVTFDGLELAESAANAAAAAQMEFGFALFRPSATDGCQNNTIRNCVVTLNKANTNTFGIYGAASTAALATSVAATSPAGANSGNKVNGNIITNAASGMYFTASTSTTLANYDQNNEIGVTAANRVYNFGTSATGWGIGGNYQNGLKIVNNIVNSTLNYAGGTTAAVAASTVTSTLRGIYGNAGPSASIDITGNTVTLASGATTSLMTGIDNGIGSTAASNTVNITGNTVTNCTYATATTGVFTGITSAATATTVNLNNNTVSNNTTAGTGSMTLIASSAVAAATTVNINNNTITGNSKVAAGTSSSISLVGITLGSAITAITGNTITNNSIVTSGTSSSVGTLVAISSTAASTPSENLSNNVITGLSISGTSSGTTSTVRGILTAANGSGDVQTILQNTIGGLSISTGSGTVTGISVPTGGGTGSAISRNKIYDLSATGAAGSVTGLLISAGGTYTVANNLIGDLRTPAATGLLAVSGLTVAGGTAVNAYYNTLYLNASSTGATFGTSGLYLNSTSTTLDVRNTIVVNKSTAAGTGGFTAALRRTSGTAGTAPANLAATSNNNLYYAGTPSATNLIYVEGSTTATNAAQTVAAYKALVAPRESFSQTEDVAFLSTTGTAATFLHINPAVPTLVEGKAQPISGLTVDFDNDARSATTPDIGADEGTFIVGGAPVDVAATVLVTPSATGCYGATESVVVSVRNNGTQALDFSANPLTVTVNVTGGATQTLTVTVNTGTLAVGASQNVTVGTLNMSAAGTYSFAIVATATGDGDTSNDNTTATRTKVALATGPQQLSFMGFTGANLSTLYPGWYEATGLTLPTGTTSTWTSDDYANVVNGPNGISAKINLFTNTRNDWMVSPRILATATSVLTYDLAMTAFAATTAGTLGSDDRLEVRVSTDCGQSFTTVKSYTAATPISATGQFETVSLASYAGQEIIVAFFATEGTVDDAPDNDVFIDNINLNPQGVDLAATALVAPTTGQGCYGTAESVVVSIRNAGAQAIDFGVNPATVTVSVTGAVTQTLTATVSTGTLAAGASQNVTVSTLDMSATGTYTFAIAATVTGDQNTANDALAPNPTRTVVAPVAGTLTASTSALCVSGTATLTLTGSANGTIQWQQSTDNVTFTDISGANAATYTTPVLSSTTYFRARTSCNTAVATSNVATITVSNPQVTNTNSPVAVCEGSTATLTATAATGTTVQFFETATGGTALASTGGTFTTPALTTSRQYFVEATSSGTESVGRPAPAATTSTTASTYGLVFTASSAFTLTSVDVYPAGTAGNLVVQVQDNTGTLIPGLTATVAIPAGTGTTAFPVPLNFNIPAGTGLRLLAISSPAMVREASIGGFPYTSPSGLVSITNGYISGTSTTYYYFYNWQISTACTGTRTAIQVNVTPAATASFPAATAASCGTSPYQLAGTVGGSATTGTYTSSGTGTFAPNATTLNATYTPSAADVAAGSVTITLTSNATAPCTGATATLALSLSPAPVAAFSYPTATTYCAGSTSTVTPTLGTGASAGVFSSTTGLSIDPATGVISLGTSTAGTYTVTNTIAASGSCAAATATTTVTILPVAVATFSYGTASTFCVSGTTSPAVVLGTGATAGTFSSTTGLTVNAATGAITLSSSTPGTYTVTNTVAASGTACGSTATTTVTITAAPTAAFSYAPASACVGSGTSTPALGTGATAGTFSSATGLTINATTGVITLSSSTAGTYTVTNTVAASGGCAAATSTATFTVNPAAVANAGANQIICSGASATLGSAAVTGTTYAWTPATGLSSATAAQPTVTLTNTTGTATTTTYTLTATTGAGCVATSTVTVTVNPAPATPTVTLSYPTSGTALLTSSTAPAGITYQWYLGTTAITGATGQTYTANGATAPGVYSVRFISSTTGCQSAASTTVTVTATQHAIAGASLHLYPNPTPNGLVTLELTGFRSATQLTVLDALGRVVSNQQLPANAGTATRTLDLTGVATGVYLLRLSNANGVETHRLVRE